MKYFSVSQNVSSCKIETIFQLCHLNNICKVTQKCTSYKAKSKQKEVHLKMLNLGTIIPIIYFLSS